MDLSDGPPIILPKGIVHNTREIYDEVASFEVIPFEKIHKYWSGMPLGSQSETCC